jgi:uncharacterized membrane protein
MAPTVAGLELAPTHIVAIAMAVLGLGLVAAAFVGEGFGSYRLLFGIALFVAAFLTVGLHLLNHHAAPASTLRNGKNQEDA